MSYTPKPFGAANWPVHRRGGDPERALEVVHQLQRIARRAVELVDERQDRQPVTPAHLEQLPRLVLDAVRRVDHHHDAVGGDEGAIGVFAEILVARRIEQRHASPLQLEFEGGGRNRDAPLLFELHPVRRGVTASFAAPDGARKLNGTRVQQQLFRQRRFARIGVRDDGERTPSRHLALELGGCGEFRDVRKVHRWRHQSTPRQRRDDRQDGSQPETHRVLLGSEGNEQSLSYRVALAGRGERGSQSGAVHFLTVELYRRDPPSVSDVFQPGSHQGRGRMRSPRCGRGASDRR